MKVSLTFLYCFLALGFFVFTHGMIHDNAAYHYPVFAATINALSQGRHFPGIIGGLGLPSVVCANNFFLLMADRLPLYLLASLWPFGATLLAHGAQPLYKLNLVIHGLVFAGSMLLLLHELGASWSGQAWGYALSLFSGVTVTGAVQEQVVASVLFMPLVLWLALRLYRTRKVAYAALLGAAVGHSFVNHYPQLVAYFLAIAAVSGLISWPQSIRTVISGRLVVVFLAFFVLMAWPPFYAYLTYGKALTSPARGDSLTMGYEYIRNNPQNSLELSTLAAYAIGPLSTAYQQVDNPNSWVDRTPFYIGILGLLMFFYGLFKVRLQFWRWMLAGILLLALGRNGFIYRALYLYPLARLERIPLHMGNFLNIPIIIISSFGFEGFSERFFRGFSMPTIVWLVVLVADLIVYASEVVAKSLVWASTSLISASGLLRIKSGYPISIHPIFEVCALNLYFLMLVGIMGYGWHVCVKE